jgi:hypothetical protein
MFARPHTARVADTITQPLAIPSTASQFAPAPSLQQRAEQLATTLPWEACRTLVEAAAPILFEHPDPFAPTDPQIQQIAEWLTREVGALTPLSAGYVQAYRPTLLGLYIIWRLLLDGARARTPVAAQHQHSRRR